MDEIKSSVLQCKKTCENQDTRMHSLEQKVDDIENRSRRCNLIFFGIEDTDKSESYDVVKKKLLEICSSTLTCNNITIERAHRSGKFTGNRPRPVIASFASFKDKQAVLSNAKKLKGSKISISEDFSAGVRLKRKRLLEYSKANKKENDKICLKFDSLYLNGVRYIFGSL